VTQNVNKFSINKTTRDKIEKESSNKKELKIKIAIKGIRNKSDIKQNELKY